MMTCQIMSEFLERLEKGSEFEERPLVAIKKIDELPQHQTVFELSLTIDGITYLSDNNHLAYQYAVYLNFFGYRICPMSTGNAWFRADYADWIVKPKCVIISEQLFENKELYEKIKLLTHQQLVDLNLYYIFGGKSLREKALEVVG